MGKRGVRKIPALLMFARLAQTEEAAMHTTSTYMYVHTYIILALAQIPTLRK